MRLDGCAVRFATAIVCCMGLLTTPAMAQDAGEPTFDALVAEWKKDAGTETYTKVWEAAQAAVDKRLEAEAMRTLATTPAEQTARLKAREAAEAAALPLLKKSIGLAPAETEDNREDLITMQMSAAFFAYQQKDYTTSAVVAEHVARTFSDHDKGPEAAKIAASARALLYNAAPKEAKGPALDRLVAINEFIGQKWNDQAAGAEAWTRLAQLALLSGDRARVDAILQKLPAKSPARWEIGLQLTLTDWSELLKNRDLPDGDPKKPADMAASIKTIQDKLVENTKKLRESNGNSVTYMSLAGELTVVQIYNSQGKPEEALKILKIPGSGLLAEAMANTPNVQQGGLSPKIFDAALQAYLAMQDFDQAEAMAEKMSGSASDSAALLKLRLSLAKRLADEVAKLRETGGDSNALAKKLAGLSGLLKKVVPEAGAGDFSSIAWAGQTMIKLASDEDSGDVQPTPVVKELYTQAATVFEKLQDRAKSAAKDSAEAKNLNAVRVNLAKSYRRLGKFEQAITMLDSVLDEAPNNLDAQIAAAQAYQDWAAATNNATYYTYAVLGGPDVKLAVGIQKSPILGWSRLATKMGAGANRHERLFEVRYNLTYSMASAALLNTKKVEQTNGLKAAEAQVLGTYRFDREMGGPALKAKYLQLLQIIQGKLGKPATGFPTDAPAEKSSEKAAP